VLGALAVFSDSGNNGSVTCLVTDTLVGAGSTAITGTTSVDAECGTTVAVDATGTSYTCVSSVLNNKSTNFFVSVGEEFKFKPHKTLIKEDNLLLPFLNIQDVTHCHTMYQSTSNCTMKKTILFLTEL
jgi:hypothetical protein